MSDRILVYGVTGSGKTFLAERISAATGIPWHAVDDLTWDRRRPDQPEGHDSTEDGEASHRSELLEAESTALKVSS